MQADYSNSLQVCLKNITLQKSKVLKSEKDSKKLFDSASVRKQEKFNNNSNNNILFHPKQT